MTGGPGWPITDPDGAPVTDATLAVLAQSMSWQLDELRWRLGRGTVTGGQRAETADALAELARLLRDSTPGVVIEAGT